MTKFTETQTFPAIAYGVMGLSAVAVAGSGLLWPVLPLGLAVNLLCAADDSDRDAAFRQLRRLVPAVPAEYRPHRHRFFSRR